ISGKEEVPESHRLCDETAHGSDGLLQDGAGGEWDVQTGLQFVPDVFVGPLLHVLIGCALQIQPAYRWRAHAEQCEASLVVGVDDLMRGRWNVRKYAEPSKRIDALVQRQLLRWDAGSTDPMKPVAASDEVAFERAFLSPQPKAHPRRIGVEVV